MDQNTSASLPSNVTQREAELLKVVLTDTEEKLNAQRVELLTEIRNLGSRLNAAAPKGQGEEKVMTADEAAVEAKKVGFIGRTSAEISELSTGTKVVLIGGSIAVGAGVGVGATIAVQKYRAHRAASSMDASPDVIDV